MCRALRRLRSNSPACHNALAAMAQDRQRAWMDLSNARPISRRRLRFLELLSPLRPICVGSSRAAIGPAKRSVPWSALKGVTLLPDDPAYLRKRAYQLLAIAKTVSDLPAIEVLEGLALHLLTQPHALPNLTNITAVR